MTWDHLSITKPHLVYIILGGFTSLFMLCSSVIKERMYIGEATIATLCGLIFGPHAANLIDPESWGNRDIVTIEFSRIVLVVQCFAVGVELPKFYMEKHWKSVVFLLVPVMTFGWLTTSLVLWWLVPPFDWLDGLVVAACITATDPVLASSVVGKGKFAKRVPKHLRDLLSAESGCNDGMAFPFVYLSLFLVQYHKSARDVSFHWIIYTILYECVFGAVFGFMVGYFARHGIKYAEQHELIDRESFLVFYFVLALFCAGSGSILGTDDLLVGFACGVGFSNDGWFTQKTEESHVSNVIDLLLNLTYFVFLGTIIPWDQFNDTSMGLSAWRLVVIAILVILFRRIPIMLALKPLIPDIKTWREALFAGHFGPIGVGAVFVAILARAELEHQNPVPLGELPPSDHEFYNLLFLVWPIVTFIVVASILVHGSSIAVFTLGKHINTLTITMSYTTANEDGPSWMNRLPRISSVSRSQARTMSDTDGEELKMPEIPPGTLPPVGVPGHFLRRVKEEENQSRQGSRASSLSGRRKRKKWDDGIGPGGPISQSAIFPQRRSQSDQGPPPRTQQADMVNQDQSGLASPGLLSPKSLTRGRRAEQDLEKEAAVEETAREKERKSSSTPTRRPFSAESLQVYEEGDHIIVENEDGEVLAAKPIAATEADNATHIKALESKQQSGEEPLSSWAAMKKRIGTWREEEAQKRKERQKEDRRHEPARAYQFGNTIIVEDENGEVVKKYELPTNMRTEDGGDLVDQSLKYKGKGGSVRNEEKADATADPSSEGERPAAISRLSSRPIRDWASNAFGRTAGEHSSQKARKKSEAEVQEEDDRHVRFTIGGVGQRMNKEDFIREMQKLDKSTRREVIEQSNASKAVKTLARQDDSGSKSPPKKGPSEPIPTVSNTAPPTDRPGANSKLKDIFTPPPATCDSSELSSISPAEESRSRSETPPSTSTGVGKAADEDVAAPSRTEPESAAERRRRLAVLEGVGDGGKESGESPAERRRREAALGVSSPRPDDDSDDDDTPRVPPARRGIRFAEPERGTRDER